MTLTPSADRSVVVLMYHRVVARSAETACYFARGTAVTPENFAAQLHWLDALHRFSTVANALDYLAGRVDSDRPLVCLTFDDGYRDIVETVLPLVEDLGAPITAFPVSECLADSASAIWVDRYYDTVHRARRRSGLTARDLGLDDEADVPGLDDLRWWTRGPLKEHLKSLSDPERSSALARLCATLDAPPSDDLCRDLYLSMSELRTLVQSGHEVGGHGRTHARLSAVHVDRVDSEVKGARALLDALDIGPPRVFAYPDGAYDEAAVAAVSQHGFSLALTVTPGLWKPASSLMEVPRFFVRDSVPDAFFFD